MFTSRGMQPVCPAQVLRPKSSGGGCTARIITKRKNRAKNARRPYKYNAITLWASFVCHKVTGNRPVWESVRFASERSRVRIPSSPPWKRWGTIRYPIFSIIQLIGDSNRRWPGINRRVCRARLPCSPGTNPFATKGLCPEGVNPFVSAASETL